MKITSLEIENFLGIGHAELMLDEKGLVLIQGENKDDPSAVSNGSGKSSLVDALLWGIYGETSRGLTGDDVVNRVAGKKCIVTIQIADEGHLYLIKRWRKTTINGKKAGVSIIDQMRPGSRIGEEIDLTKGKDTLTQLEINRVMGCTKDVFTAAIYAGQEAMPDLPKMTDKALKVLIEEAAGINILERAYEIARTKVTAAEAEFARVERERERAVERRDTQGNHTDDLAQQWIEWDAGKGERVAQAEAKAKVSLGEAIVLSNELKRLRTKEEIEADIKATQEKVAACDADIAAVKDEQLHLAGLLKIVSEKERLASTAERDAERHKTLYAEAARHRNHLNKAEAEACSECGRPLEEKDRAEALRLASAKIETLRLPAANAVRDAQLAVIAVGHAKTAAEEYRNSMSDITEVSELRRTLLDVARTLTDELRERERKQDALEARKLQTRSLNDRRLEVEAETNPFVETLLEAKAKHKALKEAVEAFDTSMMEASEALAIAQAVAKVYGPKGVRAHIIDTVTPFLNDRTALYLGTLSDGAIEAVWNTISITKGGDVTEKFSITVEKNGGGSFLSLSGGEKRKVRLACALALQDLVASRASKPIELWVGDEIDEALDEAGLERLMSVLEAKARERGTVLIISHNDIADWAKSHTTVTMKGGKATVDGVLCR